MWPGESTLAPRAVRNGAEAPVRDPAVRVWAAAPLARLAVRPANLATLDLAVAPGFPRLAALGLGVMPGGPGLAGWRALAARSREALVRALLEARAPEELSTLAPRGEEQVLSLVQDGTQARAPEVRGLAGQAARATRVARGALRICPMA